MDLASFAGNIEKRDHDIYFSKTDSYISYPDEGNSTCFEIEEGSFWFSHRNKIITEAVRRFGAGSALFDIGGGNGYVAKALQDAGMDVVLVEPGITGAINAKKRNLTHVVCSTLEDADFKLGSLDAVGLFDVVEHIEDDLLFLSKVHRYLKEGGYVYITVPAYQWLWSSEDLEAGHFRRYTRTGMVELLRKCGFSVDYASYFFSILPLPILLFRSLPSRLGLSRGAHKIQKQEREHRVNNGWITSVLQKVWNWELARVRRNARIGFGGSCLIVARKLSNAGMNSLTFPGAVLADGTSVGAVSTVTRSTEE